MADTGDSGRFREDLSKLWTDMYYGNGKPGVTTRIQRLEDAVEDLKSIKKQQEKIMWLIVSVVILAVLQLVLKH